MYRVSPRAAIAGAILLLPLALNAQRSERPRRERGPRSSVSALIDARRELDLTARQLSQLDSLERAAETRNGAIAERLRAARDSQFSTGRRPRAERMPRDSADRMRRRELTQADRDSLRARVDALRPLFDEMRRNDSTARASAERILTDDQRQRWREMEIERRAELRGRMLAMRDRMGQRFGRGFDRGFGPRRFGPRDGWRPDIERRMERRDRFDRFRDRPMGPRERPMDRPRPIRPTGETTIEEGL